MSAGVCKFCGIPDEQIDGDRICWLNNSRTVCNQPACVRAARCAREIAELEAKRRTRKRTPGEVHAIKLEEARARRRRSRERSGKRGAA